MKVDLNSHFPHPVLAEGTGDFLSGSFDLGLPEVRETTDGNVEVDFEVLLSSSDVRNLVDEGIACTGAFVRCQDTYFSDLLVANGSKGTWRFDRGALYGRVEVKPTIWLVKPLEDWTAGSLNPEFGKQVSIRQAGVLGLADDIVFSVGQDKLRKFESIFELVKVDDDTDGILKVDLQADSIRILAPDALFRSIELLRGTKGGRPLLLSAVYMPVVMEVLETIREQGNAGLDTKPWYRVFAAKCEHMGIDFEKGSLIEGAQKLLGSPVRKVGNAFQEIMDNV